MAQTPSRLQDSHSEAETNNTTSTHPPAAGSQYKGLFTKSCKKTDPLSQKHFSPRGNHLPRQKRDSFSWSYDKGDHFVACQDLTSRSSQHLQDLECTLLGLRSQCCVLRIPGDRLKGCVTGLSASGEVEFNHHFQAAVFSHHYAQLQHLLEQRAQLLFLHEYGRRCRAAKCFVSRLTDVLKKVSVLASRELSLQKQANAYWNLNLRAICEELQVHLGHWDVLYARARSNPFLGAVLFSHTEMLGSMQRDLWLLGHQALMLMEVCLHMMLEALAAAQLVYIHREALEDLLSAIELYNHSIANPRYQKRPTIWSVQTSCTVDCSPRMSGLFRKHIGPGALPMMEVLRIVGRHRAKIAAKQLYSWTCQQTDFLSLKWQTREKWTDWNCPHHNVSSPSDQSKENQKKKSSKCSLNRSSSMPLFMFVHQDREDILETLFQIVMSSTHLLAPHILKRPPLDRNACAERNFGANGREEIHQRAALSNMDVCVALFSQYRNMLWMAFGEVLIRHFYYPTPGSNFGGLNLWNNEMLFLLFSWIRQTCKEESVPAECKDALNKFRCHILCTAAFMHWDAIMCESLGLGTNDKCLPRAMRNLPTVKSATMDLTLQLFPPLLSVLHFLHTNSGEQETRTCGLYHLDVLCRVRTTVESSAFWVVKKAHQFLASWSLTKFVLVTQGDINALKEVMASVVQQLNAAVEDSDHLIKQYILQIIHAVSQLQVFSKLVLKTFSMDCKKMSMEIFEQTMPSAKHWKVKYKPGLPSNPSDYAAFAAQSVLGQVFEGVQPLPDKMRISPLAEATTAFMEAWMEHILKQRIKFSVYGALQLKQDFDLIRELIRSEKYSLSEELHHRLLSLRVFYKVDSAIVCLLQQPVNKPYMPSHRWEPFRNCCPNRVRVVDQAIGSLNNLETIDIQTACQQVLTRTERSASPELLSTAPPETYLAVAQQEWLDLRIHTSSRWRIPGLRCFTKSEP